MFKWDMQSCDTLAVTKERSAYKSNMLAKNSDRPIGEAQPLVWIPAANHKPDEKLNCTGIIIPQIAYTYGVLGSKPYWIWGFEMGLNDQGVVIGNEAENSKDRNNESQEGLLGMDLLRLGLERGGTAKEALEVIVKLLEKYGQNHNANALFDARYENSYIIMDYKEIWILETAGRRWAAKKLKTGIYNIGNCYSLETDVEIGSPDLEQYAREKGWLLPDEKFNFSKAYMANIPAQTLAIPRWRRVAQLANKTAKHDFTSLKKIFRDHYEDDELLNGRYGTSSGYFPTICRHALTWQASQTGASMLVYYKKGIGPVVREAFSQPCCSIFLPAYVGINPPARMSTGGAVFSEDSLWWLFDRLIKMVGVDSDRFAQGVHKAINQLEQEIEKEANTAEEKATALMEAGNKETANKILYKLMDECSYKAEKLAKEQYANILHDYRATGATGLMGARADFLQKYCDITRMKLV